MRFRDWLVALTGFTAVAFSIFAVGGVLRWTQAVAALLTAVAVAATALSHRRMARISPLVALLAIASGLTLVQILPLPSALIERLAPTTAALRADGAELLDLDLSAPLSADSGATLGALVMLLTLLGIALVGIRIATSERGRFRIIAAVGGLCGIAAIATGIHKLFGLRELYGVYAPEYAAPPMLGPLLNSNSLACLTAAGAMLCIGLAAHRRQPGWMRAGWLVMVAACGAVTVGTVSRGATLALFGGSIVTVALLVAQRFAVHEKSHKRRARLLASALPMATLVGCLLILVIYSNAGHVERQLSQLSFEEVHYSRSKFAAWQSALGLIEDSPWLGVGRGAFEATFTRVHEASGLATYAYLENEYLQAAVDWGIPGALLLGACALWLAYAAARRWRDGAVTAGALGALVVVAVQANVDFGLQFLGLAAPVTAIAATVAYVPLREAKHPVVARALRVVHALALAVGAALLFSSVTTTLDEDRRDISKQTSLLRVRESVSRHPLDYYGYAVAAELLDRAGDPQSIRLLNHAMALHPTHPQLHRMAARMLLKQGRTAQAAIEYAEAVRTTEIPRPLLAEIVAKFSSEQAAAALPVNYAEPSVLVAALEELQRTDVARIWLSRVLELQSHASDACELLYKIAERGDVEAAAIAAKRCRDRLPDYQSRLTLAKILVGKQSHAEAIHLLHDVESWQARRDDKIDAWLVLCDCHIALGYLDEAKRCLRRLDASPDMLDARRTEVLTRIEQINRPRDLSGSATAPSRATNGSATVPQ